VIGVRKQVAGHLRFRRQVAERTGEIDQSGNIRGSGKGPATVLCDKLDLKGHNFAEKTSKDLPGPVV
jgi:hypothetical protein